MNYKTLIKGAAALSLSLLTSTSLAQEWPERSIRLVVPYAPGGMTDVFARPLGAKLQELLGQPVVIDNRSGAGGTIGSTFVARSDPDGYTFVLGTFGTHAVNDTLLDELPYDSLRDFTAVAPVAAVPSVLSVPADSSIKNLADLLAQAKAKPGELTHASTGVGASPQLLIESLKQEADVDITDVMYNGGGPALTALIGGHVSMIFDTIGTSLPHIQSGRIRPIAISSPERSPLLPDVPTVAETLPGFSIVPWFAVWAPEGTPEPIVQKLNAAINTALESPEVGQRFTDIGALVMGGSVEDFAQYHREEVKRWAEFIERSGIKPN